MSEHVAEPVRPRDVSSLRAAVDGLVARRRAALAVLAVVQLAATIALGLSATRNGWAWFQGGDQIWYTTDAWLLGGGRLPPGEVAYGWPLLLAPITWLTGATWLQAMPLIAALNVLVLAPVGLLCVYAITARLLGRLLGLLAACLWVAAPFVAIPLWVERYQERWVDQFLPQALGLSALADFPSMVVLLVGAWLLLRAVDARSWTDAAAAGLVVGFAGAMKPPNLLFLAGALLALGVARRWREAGAFVLALAPALLTLLLWKWRGLGSVPLFALEEARLAAGAGATAVSVDRYVDVDWAWWKQQMAELHEFHRAALAVQLAPLAGAVALALRRRWAGLALLAGWLAAFLVVKGASPLAGIELGSFFRLLMPAWPAYLLLLTPLVLLVPTLPRRLGTLLEPPPVRALGTRWLLVAAVGLAVVPFLLVALARPLDGPERAVIQPFERTTILTPVDESIELRGRRAGQPLVLSWDAGASWRGDVSYVVLRADGADTVCETAGVTRCTLTTTRLGATRQQGFLDPAAPAQATYRVGVAIDYRNGPGGDIFAVSPPLTVRR
jgi:hypothetical protein